MALTQYLGQAPGGYHRFVDDNGEEQIYPDMPETQQLAQELGQAPAPPPDMAGPELVPRPEPPEGRLAMGAGMAPSLNQYQGRADAGGGLNAGGADTRQTPAPVYDSRTVLQEDEPQPSGQIYTGLGDAPQEQSQGVQMPERRRGYVAPREAGFAPRQRTVQEGVQLPDDMSQYLDAAPGKIREAEQTAFGERRVNDQLETQYMLDQQSREEAMLAEQRRRKAEQEQAVQSELGKLDSEIQTVSNERLPTYWENQGVGRNIGAALAVGLGAFGSGITGGPNFAQQIIDRAEQNFITEQTRHQQERIKSAKGKRDKTADLLAQRMGTEEDERIKASIAFKQRLGLELQEYSQFIRGDEQAAAMQSMLEKNQLAMAQDYAKLQQLRTDKVSESFVYDPGSRGGMTTESDAAYQKRAKGELELEKMRRELEGGGDLSTADNAQVISVMKEVAKIREGKEALRQIEQMGYEPTAVSWLGGKTVGAVDAVAGTDYSQRRMVEEGARGKIIRAAAGANMPPDEFERERSFLSDAWNTEDSRKTALRLKADQMEKKQRDLMAGLNDEQRAEVARRMRLLNATSEQPVTNTPGVRPR